MSTWVYDAGAQTVSCTFTSVIGQAYFLTSEDPDSASDVINPATSTTTTLTATGVGGLSTGDTFYAFVNHGLGGDPDLIEANVFAQDISSAGVNLDANWSYDGASALSVQFGAPTTDPYHAQVTYTINGGGGSSTDDGTPVAGSSDTTVTVTAAFGPINSGSHALLLLFDDTTGFPIGARILTGGSAGIGYAGTPGGPFVPPTPPVSGAVLSPPWRFVILDLATFETLAFLDTIGTGRQVTYTLDAPAQAVISVPSDNPEVNIPWPTISDDPFVAEGNRALLAFRRDGVYPNVWTIRFAGIIEQLEDTAQSDNAVTQLTAWDPWQHLMARPVQNADGSLPGTNGLSFSATRAEVIIGELLNNTILNNGAAHLDMGADYGGTGFYTGTIEMCAALDINFQQGTSVGEAWQQLTNNYDCDIIIEPIYDPINRPGYLGQVSVYNQAGSAKDNAIFAWDLPSKSLVQISRLYDGTLRANKVKFFAGQGGTAVGGQAIPVQTDAASVTKYGEYWRQQFFPGQNVAGIVELLAQAELAFSKNGRETVTISPAPERSPSPFLEYFLGDRVPVYASSQKFRTVLSGYQRIYGIPIAIRDDGLEQVQQLLTTAPTS